jgi:negative regulator of sigma E activity
VVKMSEQISGWIDGETEEPESARVLAAVHADVALRARCASYWVLGDVLRGQARPCLGAGFTARVMHELEREPTVLAPRVLRKSVRHTWYAAAAAVSGVVVAVWMGLSMWPAGLSEAGLAPVAVAPVSPSMGVQRVADTDLDERAYLMAHRASVMGSPVGVAASIRTVSDERMGGR